jgi:hypothetical protein
MKTPARAFFVPATQKPNQYLKIKLPFVGKFNDLLENQKSYFQFTPRFYYP